MHRDRTTSIGIILGIGIIFGVLSMVSIPETKEFEDPFSYHTMKSKLMQPNTNLLDENYP